MIANIRPELSDIFADVFTFTEPLTPLTSPDDVPKWDSLRHIALVSAIEETYKISLSMDEMMEMVNVRAIQSVLDRHRV
jgi:acyl carrier protein